MDFICIIELDLTCLVVLEEIKSEASISELLLNRKAKDQ